ncbi:MAG TPA: hypothetical protein VHB21_25200 [Minicystis sp.]|nr:hypothetical protein [Minicystis sp.]
MMEDELQQDAEPKPAAVVRDEEWRGSDGAHGRFAIVCTLVVVVLLAAFWAVRAGLLG